MDKQKEIYKRCEEKIENELKNESELLEKFNGELKEYQIFNDVVTPITSDYRKTVCRNKADIEEDIKTQKAKIENITRKLNDMKSNYFRCF